MDYCFSSSQRPPRGYSGSMSGPQSMKSPTGVANNNPAASNREEENNQVNSRHHQQGTGGQQPPTARGPPGAPGQHGGPPAARSSNPPMYVDAQQLFVGNLPHNCTEQDLEELFNQFGKVAEIRINNKGAAQSKTTPQGQRVPNFGFVVFEEERSVQDCLGKRPIHLYGNHRLNVEEKKNKVGVVSALIEIGSALLSRVLTISCCLSFRFVQITWVTTACPRPVARWDAAATWDPQVALLPGAAAADTITATSTRGEEAAVRSITTWAWEGE
jgi:hypothetical protein